MTYLYLRAFSEITGIVTASSSTDYSLVISVFSNQYLGFNACGVAVITHNVTLA